MLIQFLNSSFFSLNENKSVDHLVLKPIFCVCHFHDGGSYHIETSPLICRANEWTGFYMIGTSAMKELRDTVNRLIAIQMCVNPFQANVRFLYPLETSSPEVSEEY